MVYRAVRRHTRPYPVGVALRDEGRARLLARFRADLAPGITLRTEVPLRGDRDLRAWDGELATVDRTCKLEAETALYDLKRKCAASP